MRNGWLLGGLLVAFACVGFAGKASAAPSTTVVISQAYGGGGNASATYTNDFIEVFNLGATTVDLTGWSVQYAAATGTGAWGVTALSGAIAPGHYLLVQGASGGAVGLPLPTPDVIGTTNLAAGAGKVALVSSTTALSGACPASATIVDLLGYGGTANCFEGTASAGPVAPTANTSSPSRANVGCVDTDVNSTDFAVGTVTPHNSGAAVHACCSTITCAASDQCHVAGVCNVATSVCSNPNAGDGTGCNDGNLCTTTDVCTAGVCGGAAVTCTPSDQCHDAGMCVLGACTNPPSVNGTSCNDGNACTTTDECTSGVCGGTTVTCGALDGCHVAGTCSPTTGLCSNPPAPDGTGCSDGNACTLADECTSGVCGGSAVTCAPIDACHVAGTCSPTTGLCSSPPAPDGTGCTDGNACTTTDVCTAGTCGGTPVTCSPLDTCHVAGTCSPTTGVCSNPTAPNGTSCSDGNACTTTDVCTAGSCGGTAVTCGALDACHLAGTCSPTTGACSNPTAPNGTACSDGNACTLGDACTAGACGGAPLSCAPLDQCHSAGVCSPTTGVCSNPVSPDGSSCNDGNACTTTDVCLAGTCAGGSPVVCAPLDQCHSVGTCSATTGLCTTPSSPDGSPCDDGDACTTADACTAGACASGTPVVCAPLDQCHAAGTCDAITGVCSTPAVADGTGCDDGNACTSAEVCTAGVCLGASDCDGGVDGGTDAAVDADVDAEVDAAVDADVDAEVDASMDADVDAATDAGDDAATSPDATATDPGTSPDGSSTSDAAADAGTTTMRGGCCHVAGTSGSGPSALALLALLGLALATRRRR